MANQNNCTKYLLIVYKRSRMIFPVSIHQVLSIRFWIPIAIMFKVWHGTHWPTTLLPLVLIELVAFMSRSLIQKGQVLRRQIMFLSMLFRRLNIHFRMILRLANSKSYMHFVFIIIIHGIHML